MTLEINTDDFWKELDQRVIDARTERKLFIEEITELRAKVAELEAQLAKFENLEPVAWISAGGDVTRSRKLHEDMGFATYPLYALEK